jgi:hypothetical protein
VKKPCKPRPRLLRSNNPRLVAATTSGICDRSFDEVLAELEADGFDDPGCHAAWTQFADLIVFALLDLIGKMHPEWKRRPN